MTWAIVTGLCVLIAVVGACFAVLLVCDARIQVAANHAGLAVSRERAERMLVEANAAVAEAKAHTARMAKIEGELVAHDQRIAALNMGRQR